MTRKKEQQQQQQKTDRWTDTTRTLYRNIYCVHHRTMGSIEIMANHCLTCVTKD